MAYLKYNAFLLYDNLKELQRSKPGSCPKVLTGFDPALVARCHKDSDCPNSEKCCPNRRLKTCQNAKFTYSSNYPPVPVNVTAVVNSPSSAVVRWSMPSNSSWRGGTMFIIEKRYSFRRVHPSHSDFSFWSFAGETNELGTVVANLNPGDWYQFRIAAHSKEGSNGHSQPSPTIKMPSEVRKPGRARNFTANEAWLKNGLIFVNISWEAPLILDLPVRRYRLTYCKYVEGSGQHYDPVRVKRKKVSGKTTHVVLNGLHPDTLYKVKIQAIVISNRQRLRGRWGKMILRTPALKKFLELKSSVSPTVRLSSPAPPRVTENSVARVKAIIEFSCGDIAIKPNGYLSAVLRWTVPDSVEGIKIVYKANHCKNGQHVNMISKQRVVKAKLHHIVLTDLYPSCSYVAKMIPYYADRTADKERNISFSTAIDGTKPHKSKKAKTKKSKFEEETLAL
eukprot:gene11778-12998_t